MKIEGVITAGENFRVEEDIAHTIDTMIHDSLCPFRKSVYLHSPRNDIHSLRGLQ